MTKITQELFEQHIAENKEMWNMFKDYAIHIAKKGQKFSANGIFHLMRYETIVKENNGAGYKLNQNWSSWYARKFLEEYPQYPIFTVKEMRG